MCKTTFIKLLMIACLIFAVGCSGKPVNPVMPGTVPAPLPLETPDIGPELREAEESQHTLWGFWRIHFDPIGMKVEIEPLRDIEAHFNITSMVTPPACDDCLSYTVNSFDPVTRIMDVDVTLKNDFQVTGYDVRGILYTDTDGHLLTNPDAWTGLWDIPGGMNENPFKAFYEGATHGEFGPDTERTRNYQIYIPMPPMFQTIAFAIDASWPGNCKEPYDISDFTIGPIYDSPGSDAEAQVSVSDWQDDVSQVTLEAPEITGDAFTQFTHDAGGIWKATIVNNEGASAGDYELKLYAKSEGSGELKLYQYVTINILEADSPVVLAIDPDSATRGDNLGGVTVTGENFAGPGAQVKLKADAAEVIIATNVVVVDTETITCDINIPLSAWVGLYGVEVTNGDSKSGIGADLFEVLPLFPVVTGIDPDETEVGSVLEGVAVTGENFAGPSAQVKLKMDSEPDIVASAVAVDDSTTITCNITIPFDAEPGVYDVEVTNDDLTVGVGEGLFIVYAESPVVSGISPDECVPDSDLTDVTISGANFAGPGAQVKLKKVLALDIVATNVVVEDSHTIHCDISVPLSAEIGLYDVEVTNGDLQTGVGEDLFEVLAFPPVVTGIIPDTGYQGQSLIGVGVQGEHFAGPGAQVKLKMTSEPDINATNVVVVDEYKITCDITIPLNAAPGQWDVEVINGDLQSGTIKESFKVYDSTPTVTAINPDEMTPGKDYTNVKINGTNFIGPASSVVKLKAPGADTITATNVIVDDVDTIICDISIPWSAQLDKYDVEVTNGYGKIGVGEDLLEIYAKNPVVSHTVPDKGEAGMTIIDVEIVGDHFAGPGLPTVAFKKAGGTEFAGVNVALLDPQHIECDIHIPFDADLGYYDVHVTNAFGKEGVGTNLFEVECPIPSVTDINPSHGYPGKSYEDVEVTGDGFWGQGAQVLVMKTGQLNIVATNVTVISSTLIECDITIPMDAYIGNWDVRVINDCGYQGLGCFLFEVRERGWVVTGYTSTNDKGNSLSIDGSDQPCVAGNFMNVGAFVSSYEKNSSPDVTISWGWDGAVEPRDIAFDSSGNVYVAGCFEGTVDFDPGTGEESRTSEGWTDCFFASYDASGNFRFVNAWGGGGHDGAYGVCVDGSYAYIAGSFSTTVDFIPGPGEYWVVAQGPHDAFLCKYTTEGAYSSAQIWGGPGSDIACEIATYDGDIYITGTYEDTVDFNPGGAVVNKTSNGAEDIYLCKYNSSMSFQWVRAWGGSSYDKVSDVTAADGIYVVGSFQQTVQFSPAPEDEIESNGQYDIFLVKYDYTGGFDWVYTAGGTFADEAHGVCTRPDTGAVLACGHFAGTVDFDPYGGSGEHSSNGSYDSFFTICDSSGDYIWSCAWGGTGSDKAASVASDSTGNMYVTGMYHGLVDFDHGPGITYGDIYGAEDYYLMKLLPNGYWY